MVLAFTQALRAARVNAISTYFGTGTPAEAWLRIYSGTRPASGGTVTTLLAELRCSTVFAATTTTATLTLNAITSDSSANATGTASWYRLFLGDGSTWVIDGSIPADMAMNTTAITAGDVVAVSSFTITDGNP